MDGEFIFKALVALSLIIFLLGAGVTLFALAFMIIKDTKNK